MFGSANFARPPNTMRNAMMPMISSSIGTARTEGISSVPSPGEEHGCLAAANTLITTVTFRCQSSGPNRERFDQTPKTNGATKPMRASASARAKPRIMFWRMTP